MSSKTPGRDMEEMQTLQRVFDVKLSQKLPENPQGPSGTFRDLKDRWRINMFLMLDLDENFT